MSNRRRFLSTCTAAAGALLVKPAWAQAESDSQASAPAHPIIVFAKPLQHLEFDELGKRLSNIGVQGIEATLRGGGQVEPKNFQRDLGKLLDSLAQHDQRVIIAASDINDASSQSEKQLRLFSKLGIPFIRTSYFHYDYQQPILPQLDAFAKQAAELAGLCKSHNITALYQNHAGKNYVGAALWDLEQVLRAVDPRFMGVAFDVRHAALESTQSWLGGYSVIRPHVGAIYVKDFAWFDGQPRNVPLGEGVAKPVFDQVKRDGLIGPLSLHVEYIDHRDVKLQEERWQAVRQDVETLKHWLA